MSCAGVLLAAGASRRFGADNKLLSDLHGRPLLCHAAQALRDSRAEVLIAVTRAPEIGALLAAFDVVTPDIPDPKQSDSLRAGVERAKALGASSLVVVLGDMPFVTSELINDVIAACTDASPSAATDGTRPMPPAAFPLGHFEALRGLKGDQGAGRLLSTLPAPALVSADHSAMLDVDTQEALSEARGMPRHEG